MTNPNDDIRADLASLPKLLQQQAYLPLSYLPGVTREQAAAVLIDQILPKVENPDVDIVLAAEDDALEGFVMVEPLPWDSGIYGMPMGRIAMLYATGVPEEAAAIKQMLMQSAMQIAHDRDYQFLDFQPHVGDITSIQAASAMGFDVIGTCLCMVWELHSYADAAIPSLKAATSADAAELGEAAAQAIDTFSRFALDPALDSAQTPEVFRQWATNSVNGYADRVNVVRSAAQISGFSTWKLHKTLPKYTPLQLANLDLAGVIPEARNKGILTSLVRDGLDWAREQEVPLAEVVTHVLNSGMQRACGQLGARTLAARHSMHWHAQS